MMRYFTYDSRVLRQAAGFMVWGCCLWLAQPVHAQVMPWPNVLDEHANEIALIIAADNPNAPATLQAGLWISPEGKLVTVAQGLLDPNTQAPLETIYVYTKPTQLSETTSENLLNRYRARWIAGDTQPWGLALLQIEDAPIRIQAAVLDSAPFVPNETQFLVIGHASAGGVWSGQHQQRIAMLSTSHKPKDAPSWIALAQAQNSGQVGAAVYSSQGHVRGMVVPCIAKGNATVPTGCAQACTYVLGAPAMIQWLAQNNMSLAVPGAPPADDPDSASDNPTPQPSTVQVVGTSADADWVRRQKQPDFAIPTPTVPAQHADKAQSKANKDQGFVAPLRPFCLSTTLKQQLQPLSVPSLAIDAAVDPVTVPQPIRKHAP